MVSVFGRFCIQITEQQFFFFKAHKLILLLFNVIVHKDALFVQLASMRFYLDNKAGNGLKRLCKLVMRLVLRLVLVNF